MAEFVEEKGMVTVVGTAKNPLSLRERVGGEGGRRQMEASPQRRLSSPIFKVKRGSFGEWGVKFNLLPFSCSPKKW
jgi:hypothetical protein